MLGKIGTPAALLDLKKLYKKETDYHSKFYPLGVMVMIAPTSKEYLTPLIEEILPHPLAVWERKRSVSIEEGRKIMVKKSLLETVGVAAVLDAEGQKEVGKNRDFDQNMWRMLAWWHSYKKRAK